MADDTTLRAEQLRESTGMRWELACIIAERERDEPARDTITIGRREQMRTRPYIFGEE